MKAQYVVLFSVLNLFFLSNSVVLAQPTSGYQPAQVDGITSRVVDNLYSRTDYWWHRGDYPRIIAEDRVITEADPYCVESYSTGAWLLESMGNYGDAEKYYLLGGNRNLTNSFMWYNVGFFYFNTLKNYPKAIAAFQRSATCPGGSINDWKMLAHSYERNNDLPKAVGIWQKLFVMYPNDGVVIHNLRKDQAFLTAVSLSPQTN